MAFVDILMLLFVIIALFIGFFKGIVKVVIAIIAFYLAIVLASLYFSFLGQALGKNSSTSLQVLNMISFFIILILSFGVLLWAGLYTFRYISVGGRLQFVDKVFGAFLGFILGIMIASVFAMILRYLFITNPTAATLDFPLMRSLESSTRKAVLLNVFLNNVLPALYAPLSPFLPATADAIFRGLQR